MGIALINLASRKVHHLSMDASPDGEKAEWVLRPLTHRERQHIMRETTKSTATMGADGETTGTNVEVDGQLAASLTVRFGVTDVRKQYNEDGTPFVWAMESIRVGTASSMVGVASNLDAIPTEALMELAAEVQKLSNVDTSSAKKLDG